MHQINYANKGNVDLRIDGASVQIKGLVKRFKDVQVINDVSIDIREGEFLALLGPSGSGKSTILMSIAGFELPTKGEILIDGKDVTFVPPHRRNIGMVFQKYALFPHMTVWENVAFPLRMRKWPAKKIEERVNVMLDAVRLGKYASRRPDQLSGGQQQRVALARALVFKPPVLLLDEPLGALDKKLREQMQFEIKQLHKTFGITVVFVTHDQEEALTMADRIVVLNEGRIKQVGRPEEIYEHPVDSFVADFIGEMNFIDGTIKASNSESCQVEIAEGIVVPVALSNMSSLSEINAGQSIRVAIRPERVKMEKVQTQANDTGTSLNGTIQDIIYVGNSLECIVEIMPNVRIKTEISKSSRNMYDVGDIVQLSWDMQDLRCFEKG